MIITIRARGIDGAIASLGKDIRPRLTQAIRKTIRAGKSEGQQLTDARYTTRISSLGKISTRASGLRGRITISGGRNLIKRFKLSPSSRPPHNRAGGLNVQVVKGQGGQLVHAFVNRSGKVYERTGRGRLPIRHLTTVSLPGAWNRIGSRVESAPSLRKKFGGIAMSYKEKVAWTEQVLKNPEAAKLALDCAKNLAADVLEAYESNHPYDEAAKEFYDELVADCLIEYGIERSN